MIPVSDGSSSLAHALIHALRSRVAAVLDIQNVLRLVPILHIVRSLQGVSRPDYGGPCSRAQPSQNPGVGQYESGPSKT